MFNEDGLGMTRVGGGNDNIVNVCKSCGHSEYLWESVEAMERVSKARAIEQRNKKIEREKTKDRDVRNLTILYYGVILIMGLFVLSLLIFFVKYY